MDVFTTFADPLFVHYKVRVLSKGYFFNFLIILTLALAPYLIAYRSQGFWTKLETFREQPKVKFKHEALVILETINDEDNSEENLVWTTFPGLKRMIQSRISPHIVSREPDMNFDYINDFLEIQMSLPIPKSHSVMGAHVLLLFEYRLYKFAILNMESMIIASHSTGTKGNRFDFTGHLQLVQKEPLLNRLRDDRFNRDVIPRNSHSISDYTLTNIIQRYTTRNVTTRLGNSYNLWLREQGRGDTFFINGRVEYTEQTYECWAGFFNILKWAWIQYFAMFIVVNFFLKGFQTVIYRSRIFESRVELPFKPKKCR